MEPAGKIRGMSKMKKETYSTDEVRRYIGAVSEQFQDGIKVIGEQYHDLKRDIKRIDETLNSHTETLNSHTGMIGQIMIQLEEIRGELKQKVDYRDFAKLERRVAVLEARR